MDILSVQPKERKVSDEDYEVVVKEKIHERINRILQDNCLSEIRNWPLSNIFTTQEYDIISKNASKKYLKCKRKINGIFENIFYCSFEFERKKGESENLGWLPWSKTYKREKYIFLIHLKWIKFDYYPSLKKLDVSMKWNKIPQRGW